MPGPVSEGALEAVVIPASIGWLMILRFAGRCRPTSAGWLAPTCFSTSWERSHCCQRGVSARIVAGSFYGLRSPAQVLAGLFQVVTRSADRCAGRG